MKIAVFGAGVAGLTAAHELARLGHEVVVYEVNEAVGGFFRSARREADKGMPSEYSWHGFGPWYHNLFDLLRQIPYEGGTVYDRCLSRPVNFGIAHDALPATPGDVGDVFDRTRMFRMTWRDKFDRLWVLFKCWTSNRRSEEEYSYIYGSDVWKYRGTMSRRAWSTWKSTFGPWIGSDYDSVSLHHVGKFFLRNYFSGPKHVHPADEHGPAWTHGKREGWLLLRGPSSEVWFGPWVKYLESIGVRFVLGAELDRFDTKSSTIDRAWLSNGVVVDADQFVLATTPFAAADVFVRSWKDEGDNLIADGTAIAQWKQLTKRGPHTQVSIRFGFAEKIRWPKPLPGTLRGGVVVADSEFNLTLFPQELAWSPSIDLGDGIQSLWTVTACVDGDRGALTGKNVRRCTKEEFEKEVVHQLRRCESLAAILKDANDGRDWRDVPIARTEVWYEWTFDGDRVQPRQPKWVNAVGNQKHRPVQRTRFDNLVVAGAHTKTTADIWSVEGAVESGRLAARLVDDRVRVIAQYEHPVLRVIARVDDLFYTLGFLHVADVVVTGLLLSLSATSVYIGQWLFRFPTSGIIHHVVIYFSFLISYLLIVWLFEFIATSHFRMRSWLPRDRR